MKRIRHRLKLLIFLFSFVFLLTLSISIGRSALFSYDLVVGSKLDDENQFLAETLAILVERNTGLKVKRRLGLEGTLVTFNGLLSKSIDFYVDFTGTVFLEILKEPMPKENLFEELALALDSKFKVSFTPILGFKSSLAIVANKDLGEEFHMETISDFAKYSYLNPGLKFAVDPELFARPEYQKLFDVYRLNPKVSPTLMESSLLYLCAGNREFDVVSAYVTDPRVEKYQLKVLKDDQKIFPRYEPGVMCRNDVLDKHPGLKPIFERLYMKITEDKILQINKAVQKRNKSLKEITEQFLKDHNYFEESA